MVKRTIVATQPAPLKDVQVKPESTETFELLVRNIPDQVNIDFAKFKNKMKAQGIKHLKNGDRISLSGYMRQALLEALESDLSEG